MTTTFENETIDHCLTAYQHHGDYDKAYFYSVTEIVPFRLAEVAFLQKRSDFAPAMYISSISTSAFTETCDTSVVLKLPRLKMQACSVVIISVSKQLSNGYI